MNYIILDLEATCWNPDSYQYQPEIIEIGACWINSYMEMKKTFSKLVRPVFQPNLSLYCKQLTGISQEDLDKSKSFDVVIEQFIDWCDISDSDTTMFAWGAKDYQMLTTDCIAHKIELDWLNALVDLKSQFAKIKGLPKPIGLDKALLLEGIEFEGSRHRALPDAINLSKLFVKYFEEWEKV
jgi:inhibitor of KinA sporulation pathway (predicted exonuclease)